jgi:hypothetical protein
MPFELSSTIFLGAKLVPGLDIILFARETKNQTNGLGNNISLTYQNTLRYRSFIPIIHNTSGRKIFVLDENVFYIN